MHSLPAVCIVTFVLMDYLYHFCRQFFVLPGFITIFQIFVKSLACHFQRFTAEWNSAFCASIAGFERNELHSLLLVYFRRLAAKKAAASFKKSLSSWSRLFSLFSRFTSLRSCRISSAKLIAFSGVRSSMSRSPFFAACTHPYSVLYGTFSSSLARLTPISSASFNDCSL